MGPYYQIDRELAARKDLRPVDKLMHGIIKDHIGKNANGWPGIATLMRELGVSRQTVVDSIRRLEVSHDLIVRRPGKGKRNRYLLQESGLEPRPVEPVQELDHCGLETRPPLVQKLDQSGLETRLEPPQEPPQEPPKEPKRRRRAPKPGAETVSIPETLAGPIFETVWREWLAARREKGKPVTARAARMQLKKLAETGVDDAIAMIENSIRNDWQGIFPLDSDRRGKKPTKPATDADHEKGWGHGVKL